MHIQSCTVCCKTESVKMVPLEVYHCLYKVFSNLSGNWPAYHRQNHLDHYLYTSIESTNWLLDCGIATAGILQKGRSRIPLDLFDTQNKEIFSASCHFEEKKNVCLTSYTVKTKPKGKEKPQIQVLWLHKKQNGYTSLAEWLLYHQIKVLSLGYGSPPVYVEYS